MHTAHDLLLNTVFYLMGICVVTGAIGRLFVEFGVVKLLENILRPLMRPLFNLPGVAALGATMTFLERQPRHHLPLAGPPFLPLFQEIPIHLADQLRNRFRDGAAGHGVHGRAGLLHRAGHRPFRRLLRLHRVDSPHAVFRHQGLPSFAVEDAVVNRAGKLEEEEEKVETKSVFIRTLNSLLDGGRTGVDVGIAIIPVRADHLYTGDDPDLRGFGERIYRRGL